MKTPYDLEIKESKKTIRQLKEHTPEIFREYSILLHAREKFVDAKIEYERALRDWRNLGK